MSFETIVAIAQLFIVPAVGWLLKNSIGRITDRIDRLEVRTQKAEDGLEKKVQREDFIRENARFRLTLEKLTEGQARIEGKIDSGYRIAAAIERLADDKERRV